ncbi:hypothetical protein FFWV33_18510 [Flavobacterium faecale]|uniref:tRNA (Guanine-N1)-methyltransferase n=1 Tax=Flavobacterium faecale TaxID=1355330 RepID=A0A2S1LI24_9FLAO|nr:hypothetical protein [Flavobacterium faecale]AWG23379.1 hypothetical protein FFWV33_18510 [Flavobacterium faecale]
MKKIIITATALLLFTPNIFSQTSVKPAKSGSLQSQFENLIEKSNSFQEYKVISKSGLLKLQTNIQDSLAVSKSKILANEAFQESQKKTIDSLKNKSAASQTIVSDLVSEKESISVLGIQIQKTVFKVSFFLIVIGLIATVFFLVFMYKRSNAITVESKLALKQSQEEFEIYKEKALEREQKAMRRLQDELNKQKK